MAEVSSLGEAKEILQQQNEVLQKILEAAVFTGVAVHKINPTRWLTLVDGSLQALSFNPQLKIEPGISVLVMKNEESSAIVEVLKEEVHPGVLSKVLELLPNGKIVVESKGDKKMVFPGRIKDLKEGDEVFVHADTLVLAKHKSGKTTLTVEPTKVTWDDIGGLDREKTLMREIIEHPIEFKQIYEGYNQKPPKGVLLYGPPGNGKTMLGKALATSIAKFYKTNVNSFFSVKGPELLSQYVGVAEESIRNLFSNARAFYKEHGYPPVIFIDEAEAILSRRGSGVSSDVEKTIVPQFLTEMDGITESNVIVILATNRPDMLDSAILREGRIDKKIRIDNPSPDTAKAIVDLNLKKTTMADDQKKLSGAFMEELFSEKYPLYKILTEDEKTVVMHLRDISSGATLTNIVSSSISNAIRRDVSKKAKKASGIKCEDAKYAVENLYEQHKGLKHNEHIEHFAEAQGFKVKKVFKF